MKKKTLLDSIEVPKPCDKSWDEMIGGDVSRFCKHCEKDIYNISAMTRQEAKKLLFQSNERVCIRMEREPDGRIKTLKKQLHQITRQMPLAAGVLTASMILSGVTNAQETKVETSKITITQIADKNSKPMISGTISDSNGAVVARIRILLRNIKNDSMRFATSNDKGFYEFKDVESSNYEIEIVEQRGFKKFVYKNLVIENDKNSELRIFLESDVVVGQTFNFDDLSVKTETPPINTNVTYQEIVPLPTSEPIVLGFPKFPIPAKKIKNAKNLSQISFTILDPMGAVIPEAEVKLTNQNTKQEYKVLTNEKGIANFTQVIKGRYEFVVSYQGFQPYKQFVQIKEKIEPNINVTLEIGSSFIGIVVVSGSEIPTFNAILQGDLENVKKSINSGFGVNTKDTGGKTALHFAVENGNLEIVKFLLSKGAKVNAKDKFNRTPILMFDGDDEEESIKILKLLIAKGADVNVQDKYESGRTLLMEVCDDENFEMAKLLLKSGANPNLKDEDGETAMQKTKSEEIKKLLKKYGAKN